MTRIDMSSGELDAAWAEVEAALPEGWSLVSLNGGSDWMANAQPGRAYESVPEGWRGTARVGGGTRWLGKGASGPTPAAALRALAAKLAGTPSEELP